ncbi:mucin-19-like [Chiloscyllium plagiosum]|uniref:mucin-19-like n=1 Tax=Chiloscyllium plagiosum TaxID=36176 RepID=UPI001CB838B6|nr:mucin-19-like [Chiloscyllium plagiosum]
MSHMRKKIGITTAIILRKKMKMRIRALMGKESKKHKEPYITEPEPVVNKDNVLAHQRIKRDYSMNKYDTCRTWGQGAIRTYTDEFYHMVSTCKYILTRHCQGIVEDFNVEIQRSSNGNLQHIFMKIEGVTIVVTNQKIAVNDAVISLPYDNKVINIQQYGVNVRFSNRKHTIVLLWNYKDALQVTVDAQYQGQLCGLCGTSDASVSTTYDSDYTRSFKLDAALSSCTTTFPETINCAAECRPLEVPDELLGQILVMGTIGTTTSPKKRDQCISGKNEDIGGGGSGGVWGEFGHLRESRKWTKDWSVKIEMHPCQTAVKETCLQRVTYTKYQDIYIFNNDGTVDYKGNRMGVPLVNGLCGTFNHNADDDFLSAQSIVEYTYMTFANSWRESENCSSPQVNPACVNLEIEIYTKQNCAYLKDPLGAFAACHSVVDFAKYYEMCKVTSCNCENVTDCICAALGGYAHACAAKGIIVNNWRRSICKVTCPSTQVFQYSMTACNRTCRYLSKPDITCQVQDVPVDGCGCPEGKYMNEKGACVSKSECPCYFGGLIVQKGKDITVNGVSCLCKGALWTCTERSCPKTCLVYGDGYHITFDGKRYSYDGNCEYVIVEDQCQRAIGTFQILAESIPCCENGVTCSRNIRILFEDRELILLSGNGVTEVSLGKTQCTDNLYTLHTVGLYLVLRFSNGITVIWDKRTRLSVTLDAKWKNKVCGLCGNFNDDIKDDLKTKWNYVVTSPVELGNSWKTSQSCSNTVNQTFPCDRNPYCLAWAQRRCNIINSAVFQACHKKVNPTPYYDACVEEACACDLEGKYLGFCTAVAVYAEACNKVDVCIRWRTPDLCPVYCDYYNAPGECSWHYQPCGTLTTKTCSDHSIAKKLSASLEGCYAKCPENAPYLDENTMKCVTLPQCTCYYDGRILQPGEITWNACEKCMCTNGATQCERFTTITVRTTVSSTSSPLISLTTTPSSTIPSTETTRVPPSTSGSTSTSTTEETTSTTVYTTTAPSTSSSTTEQTSIIVSPTTTGSTTETTTTPETTSTASSSASSTTETTTTSVTTTTASSTASSTTEESTTTTGTSPTTETTGSSTAKETTSTTVYTTTAPSTSSSATEKTSTTVSPIITGSTTGSTTEESTTTTGTSPTTETTGSSTAITTTTTVPPTTPGFTSTSTPEETTSTTVYTTTAPSTSTSTTEQSSTTVSPIITGSTTGSTTETTTTSVTTTTASSAASSTTEESTTTTGTSPTTETTGSSTARTTTVPPTTPGYTSTSTLEETTSTTVYTTTALSTSSSTTEQSSTTVSPTTTGSTTGSTTETTTTSVTTTTAGSTASSTTEESTTTTGTSLTTETTGSSTATTTTSVPPTTPGYTSTSTTEETTSTTVYTTTAPSTSSSTPEQTSTTVSPLITGSTTGSTTETTATSVTTTTASSAASSTTESTSTTGTSPTTVTTGSSTASICQWY